MSTVSKLGRRNPDTPTTTIEQVKVVGREFRKTFLHCSNDVFNNATPNGVVFQVVEMKVRKLWAHCLCFRITGTRFALGLASHVRRGITKQEDLRIRWVKTRRRKWQRSFGRDTRVAFLLRQSMPHDSIPRIHIKMFDAMANTKMLECHTKI